MTKANIFGIFCCLVVAGYFLATFGYGLLNSKDYAYEVPQVLRYVVAPSCVASFFLISAFLKRGKYSLVIGINGLAILASLFLVEIYFASKLLQIYLGTLGDQSAVSDREHHQKDVLLGFPPRKISRLLEVDELGDAILGGLPGATTLLCSRDRGRELITYKADRYGFNNPDAVYNGQVDIAIFGDSFVEGICLPRGKDVASQVRQYYPATLGMGMRGNGPMMELAAIGRFGDAVRPRHVIMAFFEGNDWRNFESELSDPWLQAALDPSNDFVPLPATEETLKQALRVTQNLSRQDVTVRKVLSNTPLLRNFLALNSTFTSLGLSYPKSPKDQPRYIDVIRRAKAITESWNGQFHLMFIPDTRRFIGVLPVDFVFDQLRDRVISAARDAGVPVLDLVPAFHREASPLRFYATDGHFSEEGAALAARLIADHVAKNR